MLGYPKSNKNCKCDGGNNYQMLESQAGLRPAENEIQKPDEDRPDPIYDKPLRVGAINVAIIRVIYVKSLDVTA